MNKPTRRRTWATGNPGEAQMRRPIPLGNIFKPHGGYYHPVVVDLRAQNLGHCGSQAAYTQLAIRMPSKPEAPLGPWHLWSEAKSLCRFGF